MKKIAIITVLCVVITVLCSACRVTINWGGRDESTTTTTKVTEATTKAEPTTEETFPQDYFPVSIINFNKIYNMDRLREDMENDIIPAECYMMYDEMGSRPEVEVTDPEEIKYVYELVSQISVTGPTEESITDCYHYVSFTLQDGTRVNISFEGGGILCTGNAKNYKVTGSGELWKYVKALQEEIMKDGK